MIGFYRTTPAEPGPVRAYRCIFAFTHMPPSLPSSGRSKRRKAAASDTKSKAQRRPGKRLALLIGNGKVRGRNGGYALNIDGIDKDLASLGGVLEDDESAGFEVRTLLEPTLIDVRRAIARAALELSEDDTLLVYYSGTSALGQDNLLYLPVVDSDVDFLEATCLDSDYVLSCLRRSRSRHQLLLMDGCHSGAFFAYNRGIPDGFCAIMSCGPNEVCYSNADGGFFTRMLVDGLRGAAADADGDGTVTTDELFRYVLPRAKALDPPSTPQLWTWNLPQPIPLVRVRQRVFLSYRRSDSKVADALTHRLEQEGYGVWMDRSDINGGTRWRAEVDEGLVRADAMILLLSKSALESDEIYKEVARALELGKPIFPLCLGPVELHGWYRDKLGDLQQIFCSDDPGQEWYPKLLNALRHERRLRHPKAPPAT